MRLSLRHLRGGTAAVVPVLALCSLLCACSQPSLRPDLGRLYREGIDPQNTTPVIVIPGVFGSKLRDRSTGAELWPGTSRMLLFGDYRQRRDATRLDGSAAPRDLQTIGVRALRHQDHPLPVGTQHLDERPHLVVARATGSAGERPSISQGPGLTRSFPARLSR